MRLNSVVLGCLAGAVVFLMTSSVALGQSVAPWKKLENSDFQGTAPTPAPTDSHGEVTTTGDFEPGEPDANGKVALTGIRCSSGFDRAKSWFKPGLSDSKKAKQLKYQQYRFDIAEYWSRELEKALKKVCGTSKDDAKAKGDKAKDDCDKKCMEMMDKFKKESGTGDNDSVVEKWCKKLDDLLNPVQKVKTGGSSKKSSLNFDSDSNSVKLAGLTLDSATIDGVQVDDPILDGATLTLPSLAFGGFHMGAMSPMITADNPGQTEALLISADGDVIASGTVNGFIGLSDAPQFTAWFEGGMFSDQAAEFSPVIASLDDLASQGETWIAVQIQTDSLLSTATGGFTRSAVVGAEVTIGAMTSHPAEPPIFGEPESLTVMPGRNAAFHVLVASASELKYQWRFNGHTLVDSSHVRGATTDTVTITNVSPADVGKYDVLVSGPAGSSRSVPATLTITNGRPLTR